MHNETAQKIANAIEEAKGEGVTRSGVALAAGIARNTFIRRLNSGGDFGVYELARIAIVLKRDPADFLPKEYKLENKVGHAA